MHACMPAHAMYAFSEYRGWRLLDAAPGTSNKKRKIRPQPISTVGSTKSTASISIFELQSFYIQGSLYISFDA